MAQGSLDVLVGERVGAGDALGTEGESGYATGRHVHFEIDLGAASTVDCINPVPYLDPSIIHCPCHA
jgi:murein DD-endopeptidase MepM/ murein hydrolase activator NlpD